MEYTTDMEVRYSETDQMGVVYHSNYFSWFDVARCRLLDEVGIPYPWIEEQGFLCPVINAEISYGVPFRFGETATIYTRISKTTPVRTTYSYRIFLKGDDPETTKPRITGSTTHCLVDADTFKPSSIKRALPHLYDKYKEIEQEEA
jgi:acyl-CoA thioester hydrolase